VLDASTGDLVRAVPPIRVARAASDSAWTAALDPLLSIVSMSAFPLLGPRTVPLGAPPKYAAVRELLFSLTMRARPDSTSSAASVVHGSRAVVLDSTFSQAMLWRGATRSLVGGGAYNTALQAMLDSTIATVGARRERLNPVESTLLDFVTAARRSDQGAMLAAQRRLYDLLPDGPLAQELPYRLLDVNRPREAIAFLERARPTRDAAPHRLSATRRRSSDVCVPMRWAACAIS
jgi:hypothetical protein